MRSPGGASATILRHLDQGRGVLLLSTALILEYEAVCRQAEHRLATGLSMREVDGFLDQLVAMAERVDIRFVWRPQLRDPGDEMVLEAAVSGRAQALVSFNRRDFGGGPASFGIELLAPGDLMRRWRS